ncbi:MAG: sigma factor-like helix-turn-helix DNA-binding protein [Planctomycetota bacterium]
MIDSNHAEAKRVASGQALEARDVDLGRIVAHRVTTMIGRLRIGGRRVDADDFDTPDLLQRLERNRDGTKHPTQLEMMAEMPETDFLVICRRVAIDSHRWKARRAAVSLDEEFRPEVEDHRNSTPQEQVAHDETRRTIRELVLKLPTKMAQLIHLRFFEGLSLSAIARALQESEAAVQKRSSRALVALRGLVESQGDFSAA